MNEDPGERTRHYLAAIQKLLEVSETFRNPNALRVVDYAKRYVADSKYFLEIGKTATALASVAYAEGLLDSLSILGLTHSTDTIR
jgi:hypothetical protein